MARSPFFEARVNRWSDEKRELVIDDCDLDTFEIIVGYMYGLAIPGYLVPAPKNQTVHEIGLPPRIVQEIEKELNTAANKKVERLSKLLKMSDKLQMMDLKKETEELLIKSLDCCTLPISHFVTLAENFDCEELLLVCAKKTTSSSSLYLTSFCAKLIKDKPKFAASLLVAFREQGPPTFTS